MKQKRNLLLAAALIGAAFLTGAPTASAKPTIEVKFDHPEKFTDAKDTFPGRSDGDSASLSGIKDFIETKAAKYMADGETLTITFTDIDLAGDFEPESGPSGSETRIIKGVYPPRLDFTYKVIDANQKVVKEGQEKLRDINFQMRANPTNQDDPLRFEKDMLNDWMRSNLRKK